MFAPLTLILASICLPAQPVHAATPAISAGGVHSLALGTDGVVRAWGDDSAGELGTGRPIDSPTPLYVRGLPAIAAIAAGSNHTLALGTNGIVYAWGSNYFGELGNGTTSYSEPVPTPVVQLSDVKAIAAGLQYSIALKRDGTVYAWGWNDAGKLGDGTTDNHIAPARVSGLSNVIAVAAGDFHALALDNDGSVWAWGANGSGQIGDGSATDRWVPVRVRDIGPALALCAGVHHSVAVLRDGTVWAWGDNTYGQLGDGTNTARSRPGQVTGLAGMIDVSCNESDSNAALASDGSLWAWGANGSGQLGQGNTADRFVPGRIAGLPPATAIAVGGNHMLALAAGRALWAWGFNNKGFLGDGTFTTRTSPVPIAALGDVVVASAGGAHSVALKADGSVWVWGNNWYGQLGDGAPALRTVPFAVSTLPGVVGVAAGYGLSIVLTADGTVWAFGNNSAGNCGDGTTIDRSSPVRVIGVPPAKAVSAGVGHGVALARDGTVWTWGFNSRGQLGEGSRSNAFTAARVDAISDVVQVSAGSEFTLALKSDGSVWAWGANGSGQLGNGGTLDRSVPGPVLGLGDVVAISAGNLHAAALKRDGTIVTWGDNSMGQLGDGTTTNRSSPAVVPGFAGALQVSAGSQHTVALASDRTVWTWGGNGSGELGDGTTVARTIPTHLAEPKSIAAVSAGNQRNFYGGTHTMAIGVDGVVWIWGDNFFGELGDGTLVNRPLPVIAMRDAGAGSIATNDWYLDLDPSTPNAIPPEKVPVFTMLASSVGANVDTLLRYRAQDLGSTASVYTFAIAPATLAKAAALGEPPLKVGYAIAADGKKDTSVACVLAQLDAAGQLQAISASGMQAYVTGVLSSKEQLVHVLDGIATANIAGSTFYVGYGGSASAMLNGGTNRGVITVPGTFLCKPQPPQTGWWWNSKEGGRGYSIEVQGNHIFYAAFLYDETGRSTWVVSSGSTSLDGSLYTGDLLKATGGQTLAGPYKPLSHVQSVGPVVLAFSDATSGTMIWPGGTVTLERLSFVPGGLAAPPQPGLPEPGWWWNAAEDGRGFFVEWQNGTADLAGYMYDDEGNPVWYIAVPASPDPRVLSGTWLSFAGGQTLTGPYKPAAVVNSNVGPLTVRFDSSTTATLTLPGGRQVPLTRFRY